MFEHDIDDLREKGLLRKIADRAAPNEGASQLTAARIIINDVEYLNFSSNDYLGLASSPEIAAAARKALDIFPFGAGASRLLSGGTELHRLLEEKIAAFKGTESALLFNSGYHANISAIPALAGKGDVIFSDELNHASIIDGCRLSSARKIVYRHRDMEHLSSLLHTESGNRKVVITDTVFSMDGDIAPIDKIASLCSRLPGTILFLDDAHGTGVLGHGRGALAHFNMKPAPWIIQMGTLSKALGSFGAFVAGNRDVTDWLTNTARGLIYSTALPSCVVAASAAAIDIVEKDSWLAARLWQNQKRAVKGIKEAGFDIVSEDTPIIAVLVGDTNATVAFAERLKKKGVYAPAIRPPTVKNSRIRVTVSAAHTDEDIDALVSVFEGLRN
jgi:8-amino-7-oxononanoate synthase